MRSEELVGVLFAARVVLLVVSIVVVMAFPEIIGAIALSGALFMSAGFSWLFVSRRITLRDNAVIRALSTHYYIDVVMGLGVVCVALAAFAKPVLVALIVIGLFILLVKPKFSPPVPNTPRYVLCSIALVASGAVGIVPWPNGGAMQVFMGILMVFIAAGCAARGQWRTTQLLRKTQPTP